MNLPVALQNDEVVVLRCRRHPVYLVSKLLGCVLAALLPIAAGAWLLTRADPSRPLVQIAIGLGALWLLVWLVRGYLIWYRHHYDEWIVTNQRLIDAYRRHWFDQRIASADLVNLQNISIQKRGLLAALFNFGDVHCETAGSDEAFVLSAIPKPQETLAVIDATRDAARRGRRWRLARRPTGRRRSAAAVR